MGERGNYVPASRRKPVNRNARTGQGTQVGTNRSAVPSGTSRKTPAPITVTLPGGSYAVAPPGQTTNAPVQQNRRVTSSSGGGGGDGGYAAAQAEAAAAKKAAGQSYISRAANLDPQIKALQFALSDEGFKKALDQNLGDILASYNAGIALLKEGHTARAQNFLDAASDTEKATDQNLSTAFENLVRERQDTMTNLLQQGAGETDMLRSMVMAARQFRDNEAETNRAYFDTMQTVKSGITDLNYDTKTGMQNAFLSLEAERDRLWTDLYNRRSDTYTQLGNLYTQKGDYYVQANELGEKPGSNTTAKDAGTAYMDAAKEASKSYTQQGVPAEIQNWQGIAAPTARQANTDLAAAVKFEPIQQAEGAGLRSW